ncbi:unnamed protein product [Fusarium equiseti]|uniref:NB-ARC domain-containing protein n=1 Tax=Fusarium equiseti TaxID=61235 RepID=A0A8J2J505_FUSEQ|nr:unnamed protein product [Fusarium equiseti]
MTSQIESSQGAVPSAEERLFNGIRAPRIPTIRPQDLGFQVYHDPQDVDEITLDVIAVHGIGVDPTATWTHPKTKRNWLRDGTMLPQELPSARIMAFAYNSVWYGDDAVKQSLEGVANSLLLQLGEQRANCRDRPIIFIGHCFGGLVMQMAYTKAFTHKEDYPYIHESVIGMVFLGTPHHGLRESSGLSTQSKVYQAILASKLSIQDNALKTMAHDNDLLRNSVDGFTRMITTRLDAIAGSKTAPEFVVNQTSGTLNGHQSQELSLDHFGMNKFEDSQDSHYRNVKREIIRIVNEHAHRDGGELTKSPSPTHHHNIPRLGAPIAIEANFAPRDGIIPRIDGLFKKKPYVALYGSPGNGLWLRKTHVAVQYAHEYKRKNPGHNVYWIGASSTEELQSSYVRIAEQLHIHEDGRSSERLIELVIQRLKREPSLMVFDGINNGSPLSSIDFTSTKPLVDLVPKTSQVSVLITTRSKAVARQLVGNRDKYAIEVGPVSQEDASMILLGKVTRDPSRKKFVEQISNILNGCAGSLTLVYFYLKNAGKESSRKDYMERLSAKPVERPAVLRAWELLYELINHMHKETVDTMLIMSCLSVQCIPSEVFNRKVVQNYMPILEGFGFVETSADRQLFAMTAIVRQQAEEFLNHNIQQREEIQDRAVQSILEAFNVDPSEALLPCALAALGLQHLSPQHGRRSQTDLLFSIAQFYRSRGNLHKALEYYQQCLENREADKELPNRAMLVDVTRQAITEVQTLLGRPSGSMEMVTSDRGASYAATRDQFVVPMSISSGQSREGDPGGYNDYIESVQRALRQASKGNHKRAEKLYLDVIKALQTRIKSHKEDIELTRFHLKVLSCLSATYCAQGRFTEALNILKTVVPEQEAIVGKSDPETLLTRNDYALLLQETDLDAADQELRMLHNDQVRLLGADSPEALRTESNLALNSSLRGNIKESEYLYRDVLQRQKSKLGEEDSDVLATEKMLSELLGGRIEIRN